MTPPLWTHVERLQEYVAKRREVMPELAEITDALERDLRELNGRFTRPFYPHELRELLGVPEEKEKG